MCAVLLPVAGNISKLAGQGTHTVLVSNDFQVTSLLSLTMLSLWCTLDSAFARYATKHIHEAVVVPMTVFVFLFLKLLPLLLSFSSAFYQAGLVAAIPVALCALLAFFFHLITIINQQCLRCQEKVTQESDQGPKMDCGSYCNRCCARGKIIVLAQLLLGVVLILLAAIPAGFSAMRVPMPPFFGVGVLAALLLLVPAKMLLIRHRTSFKTCFRRLPIREDDNAESSENLNNSLLLSGSSVT